MLKIISSFLLFTLLLTTADAASCIATKREVTNKGIVTKTAELEQNTDYTQPKYEVDIEEAFFSLFIDHDNITAMIVIGPDYTTGNLFKGEFDSNGEMKLTYITPGISYLLNCTK